MSHSNPRKRRGRHDIVMEILKIAKEGMLKTKIMEKGRLSYTQLQEYLNALKEKGFIVEKSGIWKTTEKGLHVIEACEICFRLAENIP